MADGEEPPASTTPAPEVRVEVVGRTDVGLVREHNEDSLLLVRLDDGARDAEPLRKHALGEKGTLLVVCDGMGGAAAGEVASQMAVERIAATLLAEATPPPPAGTSDDAPTSHARKLRQAARDANLEIFREARANLARSGMGTTMTALWLVGGEAVIAQVGDSRAYVWRKGRFTQVTRDQSLVNQLLETGHITPEQAKFFEHSNVILQALGVQEEVEVQLSRVTLRQGDRFMLCSDGLVGVVTDEEIGAVLGACEDPDEAARILIEMANGAGGPDNVTVIVARVEGEALPEPTAEELVEYKLWKIDPEAPPPPPMSMDDPPTASHKKPDVPPAARARAQARRPSPLAEWASMAVVCGLILGSVVTGALLYRGGVACRLEARLSGLTVMTDGRDSGVRTPGEGAAIVRLPAGHHTLALAGPGAPEAAREVMVARGQACEVDFEAPAPEGMPR